MRHVILTIFLSVFTIVSFAQYIFEKYPAVKYKNYKGWKMIEGLDSNTRFSMSIPKYFGGKDTLTILLTSSVDSWDSSFVSVYRNQKQIARYVEHNIIFIELNTDEPIRVADINGDGMTDVKLTFSYMSNGLGLRNRVIYLFQQRDGTIRKVSFLNNLDTPERDFNADGNYEIIAMSLVQYENHSYWLFNLFNFNGHDLASVNSKYDYPIMIQFLYRENYKITDKISRQKMKEFGMKLPEEYSRE